MSLFKIRRTLSVLALSATLLTGVCLPALADEQTPAEETQDYSDRLLGDIGGVRSRIEPYGIDLGMVYTADFFHNVTGGIETGSMYMDNLDITADIDGEKLYGLKGSKIFLYLLNNAGGEFNTERVGSNEGVDNIEVGEHTFKLYEAWIEQNLLDDKLSLRAGLYDLNSEFDVTDSSGIFLNPTFGIDTAYAATGEAGPSIFPLTSLAFRVNVAPVEDFYIRAAVLDGVPGDPDNPRGTHVVLDDDDGILLALESAYGNLDSGRIGAGGWWYSEESDHLTDTDALGNPEQDNSSGLYALAEKTLFRPDGAEGRHLDGFVRFAWANDDVNQFDYSGSLGLAYTGPFAARPDDIAGIALHGAHNGDPFEEAADLAGEPVTSGEWGIEATYSYQATPWLRVQPDAQYINDPGTTDDADDAFAVSVRLELNL